MHNNVALLIKSAAPSELKQPQLEGCGRRKKRRTSQVQRRKSMAEWHSNALHNIEITGAPRTNPVLANSSYAIPSQVRAGTRHSLKAEPRLDLKMISSPAVCPGTGPKGSTARGPDRAISTGFACSNPPICRDQELEAAMDC